MRNEQEKKTMNERIQAFYAQSGGPNNPQISRIIEKHLLDGKDHGTPGKRETFRDAIRDVFLDDYSTKDIVMWLLKTKYDIGDRWEELIKARSGELGAAAKEMQGDESKLEQMEERLLRMEENLNRLVAHLQQPDDKNGFINKGTSVNQAEISKLSKKKLIY
ncbi:hypothetical protein [Bacillus sp. CECT 9360]|uniref:hypothetical protein n=1 Tax=Bacillus sp. CECT 9360 TaxID=2845821 RepID=UPI001E3D57FF|nr:hypothetical protein [Bacillus sp. CECT 9360]CAH0347392.1 hypothetical protein BCI9360_03788 [Bacillus sp. CECT 9360]